MTAPKITYHASGEDRVGPYQTYMVRIDGDRLGWVRQVGPGAWCATDTYLVAVRGTMKSRKNAVATLLRRRAKRDTP